ncbi:NADH-quinone oxidoreductase subunit A [Alkalispirochaeta odontotermitis]|nr:NADH-quinone oxidoreductase subunit A [Alkalispirochaeta odontotermitis]CAB1069015.1 NADH ubiquinone oxidoreductase chain A (EC [Olavius algarvensis Delta 1 endosymbiont]
MLLSYLPILIMMGFVSALALAVLFVSSLLRPSNPYREKLKPWECGFEPIGEASKGHFRIHFFIIAILFIIFDVETLFLFPWAVILADKSLAMFVFIEMILFIAVLAIGLIYAWVKGALEWVD